MDLPDSTGFRLAAGAAITAFRKSRYYARARLLRRFAPRNDIGLHSPSLRARRSRAWQSRSRTISEMEYYAPPFCFGETSASSVESLSQAAKAKQRGCFDLV